MQKLPIFYALMLSICASAPIYAHKQLEVPLSFTANDYQNPPDNNALPPSASIAVGPCQVLVGAVNGVYSFTKDGKKDFVLETSNPAFFGEQEVGIFWTHAVQVRFDTFSQRWFAVTARPTPAPNAKAVIYITVSDGPVISDCTVWRKFRFEQDIDFRPTGDANLVLAEDFSFASFGIDQNALYIGLDLYSSNNRNNYVSSSVFVLGKQSLLFGTPVATAFRNLSIFAPVGVDNFDANPEFGYIIGVNRTNPGIIVLYRIANAGSATPTISSAITIPVDTMNPPVFPFFKNVYGTNLRLLTFDNRLFNAHIRDNNLFTVQHIGVNALGGPAPADRTGVRWYQISNLDQSPTVLSGTLFDPGPLGVDTRFFSFPAVMTNDKGLMVISGTISSQNTALNAFATHRHIDDAVDNDKLRDRVQFLTTSDKNYVTFGAFTNRGLSTTFGQELWGQYTASAPDGSAIWTLQPFAKTNQFALEAVKLKEKK